MSSVSPYQLIKRGVGKDIVPSTLRFVKALASDSSVASITPSSVTTSEAVCETIDFSKARTIIELGPGDGAITKGVLENLAPRAKLYAVESNESFVELLEQSVNDPRLTVFHRDARNFYREALPHIRKADVVVSGIPFSLLSDVDARDLLTGIAKNLNTGGQFVLYQTWIPPFFTPYRCKKLLTTDFTIERTKNIYKNIPPLQVISTRLAPQ